MSRWNRLIKIGASLYLTDTQLVGGSRIITDVSGLDQLREAWVGSVVVPIVGAPKVFVQANEGFGIPLSITMARMPDTTNDTLDDIIALHNTAYSTGGVIRIIVGDQANDGATVDVKVGQPGGVRGVEYPGG